MTTTVRDWRPLGLTLEAALNRGDDPALLLDENSPLRGELRRLLAVPAEPATEFCWLVELFHRGGNSLGRYHTGLTDLHNQSRSTANAYEAKRYYSKDNAQGVADDLNLHMMACEWRAVEHGFVAPNADQNDEEDLAAARVRGRLIATTLAVAAAPAGEASDLARDAARYRWLVENSFDREGSTQLHVWLHTWEPHSQTGEPTEWKCRVRGPAIDRAIDGAMGAATPKEKT